MSTRSKIDDPLPLSDPELIIRQANAAKRRDAANALKHQQQKAQTSLPTTSKEDPLTKMDSSDHPSNPKTAKSGSNEPNQGPFNHPKESDMDNASFLRGLLQLQHTAILQAKEDRKTILADQQEDAAHFAKRNFTSDLTSFIINTDSQLSKQLTCHMTSDINHISDEILISDLVRPWTVSSDQQPARNIDNQHLSQQNHLSFQPDKNNSLSLIKRISLSLPNINHQGKIGLTSQPVIAVLTAVTGIY
ncbi:hypothetical protein H4Q26_016691 [Puccinia striiformis f. sp. tritici PST-130]|nr:hypothetical protein H4Q26_016691 [Puccinia striiformis f. sp. tritici PST-130]